MLNADKLSYWEYKTYLSGIDFMIIGAGIVGYSTAHYLKKRFPDAKILILERGFLPSGASTKNAGFACFGSATELYDDLQKFGEEMVWSTVAKRWQGLQNLRAIIGDEQLKLEVNGSWDLITENDAEIYNDTKALLSHFNSKICDITGEESVYSIDDNVSARFGFKQVDTSFYNRLEGQIDTASMNDAFYRLINSEGTNTLFGIEVLTYSSKGNFVEVQTNIGTIAASNLFICTNGFASRHVKGEDIKPARAQVLVTKEIKGLKVKGTFHYDRGYYYFRNIDNRLLFGGGRNLDFDAETTEDLENTPLIINRLINLMDRVILPDTPYEIDRIWSGIMGVGSTKKPIVKPVDENVYCGVRLGGMGVAIGSLVGEELSEMIK